MTVTIEDLAAHLNLPNNAPPAEGSAERAELQRFFASALSHVQKKCGPISGQANVRVSSAGGAYLVLPATQLASIDTVTDPNGTVVAPVMTDPISGVVEVPAGVRGVWTVQVTADGERVAALETAVLEITKHLYGSQRVTAGGRPGGQRPGAFTGPTASAAFSIPNRAKELMAPHLLPGIA